MSPTRLDYEALSLREATDAVIVTTLRGEIVYWSKGAERVFGYAEVEAVGRTVNELVVPPERVGEEEFLRSQARTGGCATFESLRHRKDGTLIYVDISSKLVQEDGPDSALV